MKTISRTLALLKPADLFPAWKWIDMMEECGDIETREARLWKEGIYGLMVLWGLEPDEVVGAQAPNSRRYPRTSRSDIMMGRHSGSLQMSPTTGGFA